MSSNHYADWGSVVHELSAMCLESGNDASAYLGRIIECEDYEHAHLSPSGAHRWLRCPGSAVLESKGEFVPRKYSMEVDDEMVDCAQDYIDSIRLYADGNIMFIEKRFDLSHLLGDKQGGTGDTVILADGGKELQVHDLKTGRGVEVFAEDNEQLMLYGLGALREVELIADVETVLLVIHQGRIKNGPDEFRISVEDLVAFGENASDAAKFCTDLMKNGPDGGAAIETVLTPGEKQCRFCKAKATCPALQRRVSKDVFDDFDVIANPNETAQPIAMPNEAKRLGTLMDRLDLIEGWIKAIRGETEKQMFAGQEIPGWKLVQGRKSPRRWSDKNEAEEALKKMRIKKDDMYSFALISPTVAEKLLKKESPRRWTTLQEFITQSDGKLHVAPDTDKRAPAQLGARENDFDVASDIL